MTLAVVVSLPRQLIGSMEVNVRFFNLGVQHRPLPEELEHRGLYEVSRMDRKLRRHARSVYSSIDGDGDGDDDSYDDGFVTDSEEENSEEEEEEDTVTDYGDCAFVLQRCDSLCSLPLPASTLGGVRTGVSALRLLCVAQRPCTSCRKRRR
jgi:hypothetical protein